MLRRAEALHSVITIAEHLVRCRLRCANKVQGGLQALLLLHPDGSISGCKSGLQQTNDPVQPPICGICANKKVKARKLSKPGLLHGNQTCKTTQAMLWLLCTYAAAYAMFAPQRKAGMGAHAGLGLGARAQIARILRPHQRPLRRAILVRLCRPARAAHIMARVVHIWSRGNAPMCLRSVTLHSSKKAYDLCGVSCSRGAGGTW